MTIRIVDRSLRGAVAASVLLGSACQLAPPAPTPVPTRTPRPPTPAPMPTPPPRLEATSDEQVAHGAGVYTAACAACHGADLQGRLGPRLDRPGLLNAGGPNGAGLYRYVATQMPLSSPGSLSSGDYYAVTAFLLSRNALLPAATVVGPATAARIVVGP